MELSVLKVDDKKVDDGIWVKWMGDIRLRIAAITNDRYTEMRRRLVEERRHEVRAGGKVGADAMEEIANECVAKTIWLEAENIMDEGVMMDTADPAVREALLIKYPPLYGFIESVAVDGDQYRLKEDEQGNSPKPSSGD